MSYLDHRPEALFAGVSQPMSWVRGETPDVLQDRVEAFRSARSVQGLYSGVARQALAPAFEEPAPIAYSQSDSRANGLSQKGPMRGLLRLALWAVGSVSIYASVLVGIAFQSRILEF